MEHIINSNAIFNFLIVFRFGCSLYKSYFHIVTTLQGAAETIDESNA
jgi:hypothetical protein